MKEDTCDKAIEILQATSDGDKLAPLDLKLIESAVNGFLSEEGIKAFNQAPRNHCGREIQISVVPRHREYDYRPCGIRLLER